MLILTSRPAGWGCAPVLYAIGVIHSGMIPKSSSALSFTLLRVAFLGFPLCIGRFSHLWWFKHVADDLTFPELVVFGVNDVYDYDSDLANPRKSGTSFQGTILPQPYHGFVIQAAAISSLITVGASLLLCQYACTASSGWQGYMPLVSTAALVAVGWMYSAPPFRLKEAPFADSLSNGVIIWLAWFVGFCSSRVLAGQPWSLADIPTRALTLIPISASVHALAAAADMKADLAAGHRTIATFVGVRGCAAFGAAA
ncbi:hypothetical protein FRC07_006991 [Ceratobasidium sp. 392]|nr:hypothetical protein FRC07_006991 [Ceratobasidium sp. 392]